MKRLFLLIAVCMIGMVLPQGMWAGVTIDTSTSGKVVVTSEKAGDFAAYLNRANTEQLNALKVNEIVFVGNFNESDLSTLKEKNCATQKKVDMAEAKFIKSASASTVNTWLFHSKNDMQPKQEGDHCLVGAEKYISAPSRSWVSIDENDIPANTNVVLKSESEFASYVNNNYEEYIKVPATFRYYKMVVTYDNNNPIKTWKLVEDESTIPSNAIIKDADFEESNLNNRTDFCNDGEYIRFGATFNYYTNPATLGWVNATGTSNDYNNGDNSTNHYQNIGDAPAPTDQGQMVMIGGTEYIYTSGQWVLASQGGGSAEYDYTQMRFDYWGSNVEEIITSIHAEGVLTDQLCNNCSNLKTLTLSAGDFALGSTVLGNGVNSLETVNIKAGVTSLSAGMFNAKSNLSSVSFDEPCQITVLPENVFTATGITSITIPSSVEEIKGDAFHTCNSLKTVIIPENTSLNYIRTNAFQGCDNIEEVHVNVSPTVHPICCEYLAFGEYSLVGQTQSSDELDLKNSKMATLYFPKDDWDYYAGNWKLGMTCDSQDELNSIKDGCDPSKEGAEREVSEFSGNNTDLNTSFENQSLPNNKRGWLEGKSPANGWQQFARTSTGIDIIVTKGKYYRTYSTPSALVKPDWMKIYRVKVFNDGFIEGQSTASSAEEAEAAMKQTTSGAITEPLNITVTGTDGKAYVIIPENTGVIRVDERTSDALYYFLELERTSAGDVYKDENNKSNYEYPYSESGDKVNYMFPTKGTEVTIGPVEKENGKIAYRIFGLLKQKTSGVSPKFSRAKVGTTLGDHRAYLKLPASVFHWSNEKVGTSQDATNNDVVVDENNTYAKISLLFDEDFEELNGGIATEIINSIEEDMYKNDSFYTLQGVKVAKPTTKGVYIHNGKKILIK